MGCETHRLRRRLERIGLAAELVVTIGARVARAVGLAAGLDPHEGVGEVGARLGGGADAEAGAVDVAPVWDVLVFSLLLWGGIGVMGRRCCDAVEE